MQSEAGVAPTAEMAANLQAALVEASAWAAQGPLTPVIKGSGSSKTSTPAMVCAQAARNGALPVASRHCPQHVVLHAARFF